MRTKKIELLAGAGTRETFVSAINAGANAIYISGYRFGARAKAANFSKEEIKELIYYAHLRNASVYVTVNTVIFDSEIDDLLKYADYLVESNVDAFIIQDIGIIKLFRSRYPILKIHASTQMNTYSVAQGRALKELGVNRIILARETYINTLKQIRKEVDIELEVFVHGALCVSYSGNCLFSSVVSNRSGNRGLCAQACRLPYDLYEDGKKIADNKYLLSPKDLMTFEYLDELNGLVDSIKIEGRLRSTSYMAKAVETYRRRLDHKDIKIEDETEELKTVFNRGFTKGFLLGENNADIINDFRPNHLGIYLGKVLEFKKPYLKIKINTDLNLKDGVRIIGKKDSGFQVDKILNEKKETVLSLDKNEIAYLPTIENPEEGDLVYKTSDAKLNAKLSVYQDETYKLIPLEINLEALKNKPFILTATDNIGNSFIVTKDIIKEAINKPTTAGEIEDKISALGNTPFYIDKLNIICDKDIFIPLKEINNIKQEMISAFSEKRTNRKPAIIIKEYPVYKSNYKYDRTKIAVKVSTTEQLDLINKSDVDYIYINKELKRYKNTYIYGNRISHDDANYHIDIASDLSYISSVADKYFNVTNIYSVNTLLGLGYDRVTLSDELDIRKIENLINEYHEKFNEHPKLEVVVYASYELMIIKSKIIKDYHHNRKYELVDRNKNHYQIFEDETNHTHINMKSKDLINTIEKLKNLKIDTIRIELTDESEEEIKDIISKVAP